MPHKPNYKVEVDPLEVSSKTIDHLHSAINQLSSKISRVAEGKPPLSKTVTQEATAWLRIVQALHELLPIIDVGELKSRLEYAQSIPGNHATGEVQNFINAIQILELIKTNQNINMKVPRI